MSIHAISKDTKDVIDRMVAKANSGDVNGAITLLNQSELTEDQKSKIAGILNEPHYDNQEQAIAAMRQRITAVVENVASTAVSSQSPSEQGSVSFADAPTSPFGNTYPCTFEFGGKYYQSATACFLAQQYTDQPKIMELFTALDPEEATALAELNPMTKERKISWENPHAEHINKDDVLMHVQRAKFGQNPDLKKQLLQTGAAYLVCQAHESYLSDNFNGSGKNALGVSLMRLRGEYGSTGQVIPPDAYHSATQSLQTRSHFFGNELYSDIIGNLFNHLLQGDIKPVTALACLNKHWNNFSTGFWAGCDLKQLCPELTILDAEKQGVKCEDEPKISKLRLLEWAREISPHVEENAGVTQLTMTKGTTVNQLIEIAKGEGMTVDALSDNTIEELGDVPIEQTYCILITNSVFTNSRDKDFRECFNPQQTLVEGHGCQMPTVQEYVALWVFTNKIFKKCLYGQNPQTFGRSSTHVGNSPYTLGVGSSAPALLEVHNISNFGNEVIGAGGKKQF